MEILKGLLLLCLTVLSFSVEYRSISSLVMSFCSSSTYRLTFFVKSFDLTVWVIVEWRVLLGSFTGF